MHLNFRNNCQDQKKKKKKRRRKKKKKRKIKKGREKEKTGKTKEKENKKIRGKSGNSRAILANVFGHSWCTYIVGSYHVQFPGSKITRSQATKRKAVIAIYSYRPVVTEYSINDLGRHFRRYRPHSSDKISGTIIHRAFNDLSIKSESAARQTKRLIYVNDVPRGIN